MAESAPRNRFTAGLSAAWSGLHLSTRSVELRTTYVQLVAVLLLMASALDLLGIWAVLHFVPIEGDASWWATVALWIARVVGIVVVLLVAPLLSLAVVNVLFPFLGERVFIAGMRVVAPARAAELEALPGTPLVPSIVVAVARLMLFFALSGLAFLVSLVPVAGAVLGPLTQGFLSARGLAWELLDPYLDKLQLDFGQQRRFVATHRSALVGFGLPLMLLMAIPVVGPLLFGLAQAAAAKLVIDVIEAPPA